ncbi:unnamed protein product [Amoebophrya sp. A25]|nr:unnamed protein product [Amoebophrya sp. A25]|eukprot:GSA25T00010411001.1
MVVQSVSVQTPLRRAALGSSDIFMDDVDDDVVEPLNDSQVYGKKYSGDPNTKALTLFKAVQHNQHVLVAQNINEGANHEAFYPTEPVDSRTALRVACRDGNVRLTRLLLQARASLFSHLEKDRWTALHSAAYHGHEAILRLVLQEASELHENLRVDGFSLLHVLAETINSNLPAGGADLMKWVLSPASGHQLAVDAKTDRLGYSEWTPLHMCAARGKMKSMIHLLKAGADLHCRTGDFSLHLPGAHKLLQGDIVAYSGLSDSAIVDGFAPPVCGSSLLSKIPEYTVDSGLLPIHLAALGGHLRTLQFLMQQGQNLNATTKRYRWTPLFFAVWAGQHAIVKEICRNGGRRFINCTDRRADSQWTPLALAVMRCDIEMVQLLVAYGGDPLVRLMMHDFPGAHFTQHTTDAGSEDWSSTDYRVSLLHLAVLRGDLEMLQTLIPLVRTAHFAPIRLSSVPLTPQMQSQPLVIGSARGGAVYAPQNRAAASKMALSSKKARSRSAGSTATTATGGGPRTVSNATTAFDQSKATLLNTTGAASSKTVGGTMYPLQGGGILVGNGEATSSTGRLGGTIAEPVSAVTKGLVSALERTSTNIGREALMRQRKRSHVQPVEEKSNGADPLFFQTTEGWSPITLAAQLMTVDPQRKDGYKFTVWDQATPNGTVDRSTQPRADVFLTLLKTRLALREGSDLPAPVVPSRFNQVSENLAIRVVRNFIQTASAYEVVPISRAGRNDETDIEDELLTTEDQETVAGSSPGLLPGGATTSLATTAGNSSSLRTRKSATLRGDGTQKTAQISVSGVEERQIYPAGLLERVMVATFIAAAHANRLDLARVLLESNAVDPNFGSVLPVQLRPLHIACASGYGSFAQLLLDFKADPTSRDESGRGPIEKLHLYYSTLLTSVGNRG